MKKTTFSICMALLFLGLTSCSNNETLETVALEKQNSLKSYKIQKDVNGHFSIDYTVSSSTGVETVKNTQSNSNEIYLFPGDLNKEEENFNENLFLENNKIGVNFLENAESKSSFVIEDEDIILANGEKSSKFLQEYSFLVDSQEDAVQLDFKVRKGINVSFVYNEQEAIYEIHLKEGESNGLSFSKTFYSDGNPIKVDFVNHLINATSKGEAYPKPRRPRGVVVT